MIRHIWHCVKIAAGTMGTRRALTGPLWVQIGIANKCNHRCVMCWDHPARLHLGSESAPPLPSFLAERTSLLQQRSFMEWDMLQDLVDDLEALGTRRVELAGRGEPMLHPAFDDMVLMLKERGFNVGVVTNGTQLSARRCEDLVRVGLDRLVLSLNAGNRETYPQVHTTASPDDYDKIVEHVREIHRIKSAQRCTHPQIMVSYVISRLNCYEGLAMIERASQIGADQVLFKYAVPYPGIKSVELTENEKRGFSEQIPELLSRARSYRLDLKLEPPIGEQPAGGRVTREKQETIYSHIPCYIGWLFALITAEGLVSPCCQCDEPVGDLRKERFRSIWNSKRYAQFREIMKQLPQTGADGVKCACDQCAFEKNNITMHNLLHFYRPAYLHEGQREFSLWQLLPAIFDGRTTRGANSTRRRYTKRRP